jgi:hypothetical protein
MSREYTKDEVREMFLSKIWNTIHYWDKTQTENPTQKDRLEGLAFSILVLLDGGTELPGFIVAPLPHESDKEFLIDKGENYYPENHNSNVKCDIAGGLHELWHEYK